MIEGEGISPQKQVYSKDLGPFAQDGGYGSPYPGAGQQDDVGADSTDVSVREP